jgi:hypothetical protein
VLIDCDSCEVRGLACGDCVVTVLLGAPPEGVVLDDEERRAIDVLAHSGLVPPLRLVDGASGVLSDRDVTQSDESADNRPDRRHAGDRRYVS